MTKHNIIEFDVCAAQRDCMRSLQNRLARVLLSKVLIDMTNICLSHTAPPLGVVVVVFVTVSNVDRQLSASNESVFLIKIASLGFLFHKPFVLQFDKSPSTAIIPAALNAFINTRRIDGGVLLLHRSIGEGQ